MVGNIFTWGSRPSLILTRKEEENMKTVVSFLIAIVICGAFFFMIDVMLMKTQGLQLIPDKTEAKSSH